MEKNDVVEAIAQLRKVAKKRNFKQTVDLVINLKQLDLKKPEHQIELWVQLPNAKAKPNKVCAFVGAELSEAAKRDCDFAILHDQFNAWNDKKKVKQLAQKYDYFIAQANIMPDVAKVFGRVLGPRGKMPNPKAGCVVPSDANLKPLVERLRNTVRLAAKTQPTIKAAIASEELADEKIADNAVAAYNAVVAKLPEEKANVKDVVLKFTMSQPVFVGRKVEAVAEKVK